MLNNITLGQYFPGESFLHRMDPRAKILATVIFISAIFFAYDLPTYIIVAAVTITALAISRLPIGLILASLKPLWILIVFTLAIHMFSTPGDVIWKWSFLQVTTQGLEQGAIMTARLVFLIVFSSLLTYTTSPIILTDGIEQLLNPFKAIGVPAHELAMMMTIALRFIPTLLEETERIMKAQAARGSDFTTGNVLVRAKKMVPILVPLFISSFRRADELATAMEARCYHGGEGRTRLRTLSLTWRDTVGVGIIVIVTLAIAWMRWGEVVLSWL